MSKQPTDEEVIQAIGCCAKVKTYKDCQKHGCPFFDEGGDTPCGTDKFMQLVHSVLMHQKAKIERLEKRRKSNDQYMSIGNMTEGFE